MSRYLGILFRIKHVIPKSARLQIYHSFIQSHLNYCSLVWCFSSKSGIESLFRMQKKGMRAVASGFIQYHWKEGIAPTCTKPIFKEHKVLTIHGIIVRNALLFMHWVKFFPTDLPISVYESVDICSPVRNTDHDTNLEWFSQFNNKYFRSSVFLKGPLLTCTNKIKTIIVNFDGLVLKLIKSALKRR